MSFTSKCYNVHCGNDRRRRGFKKCGRCKLARYCNRQCQEEDWPWHKLVCSEGNASMPDRMRNITSLLAEHAQNILFKARPCMRLRVARKKYEDYMCMGCAVRDNQAVLCLTSIADLQKDDTVEPAIKIVNSTTVQQQGIFLNCVIEEVDIDNLDYLCYMRQCIIDKE